MQTNIGDSIKSIFYKAVFQLRKHNPVEDLKKAKWYIDRLIKKMEEKNAD